MSVLSKIKTPPARLHWILFASCTAVCLFLFVHPDVVETSNHSYLLLDSLFSGRFFQYYNDIMAHDNPLYYINNAHYNIAIYLIFAIAELPVFLFNAIFGTAMNQAVLYFIGKLVSVGFFVACIPLVYHIAQELGLNDTQSRWASLFFVLWPPAFFSSAIMGQYDSICLFFLLAALLCWMRKKTLYFALWIGAGAACKFFPLLMLLPLLLLIEKRLLHILKYAAISLWLLLPTTLLFWGRTGDMGVFTNLMLARLFDGALPAGLPLYLFPIFFFLLCFLAYLWRPAEENVFKKIGLWLCLAVLGCLFLFVSWHPQWLILLAPFVVLTTFLEKQRIPWFFLDILFAIGFFLFCAVMHPNQLEANLFDFGMLGLLSGLKTSAFPLHNTIAFYYNLVPMVTALPMVLCGSALVAGAAFKIPLRRGTPASLLSAGSEGPSEKALPIYLWAIFGIGMSVWFLPTVFTWLKCFGVI